MANSDSEEDMQLRRRIELYLQRTRTSPTRFGRDAVNDPRFVFDLRNGREAGEKITRRVSIWIERQDRERSR